MKYISLFAGIGGFDLALNRLGHECVYANEWDKYAAQIYEKNFNHKPDTRDIRAVDAAELPDFDLLCGGFPCQAFSIAGKRGGFSDTRGTLFYEIARIAAAKRPAYLLLENVKGLLNHDNGRTFQTIMRALDELGYDAEWQVLNSKNHGVPQNRERIFIICNLRGKPRPKILPFCGSNSENKKQVASTALDSNYWKGVDNHGQRTMIYWINSKDKFITDRRNYTPTLKTQSDYVRQTLVTENEAILSRHPRAGDPKGGGTGPLISDKHSFTVDRQPNMVLAWSKSTRKKGRVEERIKTNGEFNTLSTGRGGGNQSTKNYIADKNILIRRLTPVECERLQGFPDNWTDNVSDTQRYKCLGNAVTVDVVYEIMARFNQKSI